MKGIMRFSGVRGGVLAAVALACAWAPGVAHAQDTLEGETISAFVQEFAGAGSLTLSCDPTTHSGSAAFTAEARPDIEATSGGAAAGPYPGTAVESGSFDFVNGVITRFDVSFEIFSGSNTITGTKALAPDGVRRATCLTSGPSYVVTFNATMRYAATINGVTSTGPASASGQCASGPSNDSCALAETFGPADGRQQCADGSDNDEDTRTDFPADPGCSSPSDNTEGPDPVHVPECSNGIDDDGDENTDFPADAGCETADDESESPDPDPAPEPECSDGIDNDQDGVADGADPGCESADDPSEQDPVAGPITKDQCKKDGFKDFPALGFKNQGDCVSAVEKRGTKPAARV